MATMTTQNFTANQENSTSVTVIPKDSNDKRLLDGHKLNGHPESEFYQMIDLHNHNETFGLHEEG